MRKQDNSSWDSKLNKAFNQSNGSFYQLVGLYQSLLKKVGHLVWSK